MDRVNPSPVPSNFEAPQRIPKQSNSFGEWWLDIARQHGKYSCCALFLLLQSDDDAIQYLIRYGNELDVLAGSNCLIFLQVEALVTSNPFSPLRFMPDLIEEVREGYSLETARFFEIGLEVFPCLVLFRDLRSTEHIVVTFKDMKVEEIAMQMRTLLTTIRRANDRKKNWLQVIASQRTASKFQSAGRMMVSGIQSLEDKTFLSAVETVFKESLR